MEKIGLLLMVFALAAVQAFSDSSPTTKPASQPSAATQATPAQPSSSPLPFVKQIRKTVAFITVQCQDGSDPSKIVTGYATGFFLTYPDKRLGPNRQFTYLVTNRHVAECWGSENKPQHVLAFGLQLNLRDGSSTEFPAPGNPLWVFPQDESVDLAVVPIGIDPAKVDLLTIPMSDLATADVIKSQGIDEGSRLLVTGYFYQLQGARRMEPIIRDGVIAMMPDEKLPTTNGKPGKIYLGDVHVFGGNSGSPVFVDVAGIRNGNLNLGYDYRMLGIVSGYYYEDAEFNLQVAAMLKGETRGNSGIAMIVPASALKDLLDDKRLQAMRDSEVDRHNHQQSTNCTAGLGCETLGHDGNIRPRQYENVSVEPELRFAVKVTDQLNTTDTVTVTRISK